MKRIVCIIALLAMLFTCLVGCKKECEHDIKTYPCKFRTCTEVGWDNYEYCTKCDYTTYNEKPALGHYIETVPGKFPTCTEVGWDNYEYCKRCDYTTYKENPALGHTFEDGKCVLCSEIEEGD